MPLSPGPILARLALSTTLALATIGFLGEVRTQARSCAAAPPLDAPVLAWRLGTPPVERLRRFLDEAHRVLPHGAVLGFASPEGPLDAAFFRRLWAAYLEPDLNLLGEADAHAYTHYILAYGVPIDRPGLSLVRQLPGGGLYRIGPP
jgi:hypothetical protein